MEDHEDKQQEDPVSVTREAISHEVIFDKNYRQLLQYIDGDGHLNLPRHVKEARRLSAWLSQQRRRKNLSVDQRERLERLNIHFGSREEMNENAWIENFQKLMWYKSEYHTFVVSKKDKEHRDLHNWTSRQRKLARQGHLPKRRMEELLRVGFEFNPTKSLNKKAKYTRKQEKDWKNMYEKLCGYQKQHGNCDVAYDYEDTSLGRWVSLQRVTKGKGIMDEERVKLLQAIGFKWNVKTKQN